MWIHAKGEKEGREKKGRGGRKKGKGGFVYVCVPMCKNEMQRERERETRKSRHEGHILSNKKEFHNTTTALHVERSTHRRRDTHRETYKHRRM